LNREQLKTILWLRWRLTRNQWQRAGGFGAVMAVIVAVSAVTLGAATFAGGLICGGGISLGPHPENNKKKQAAAAMRISDFALKSDIEHLHASV
jgi:hypothetical protein